MPHRALMVDEILREVATWVTDVHRLEVGFQPSLSCLLRQIPEEPTLSVRWKIQDELPTLIKTLPLDSWELQPATTVEDREQIVRDSP